MRKNWLDIHVDWHKGEDRLEILAVGEQNGEAIKQAKAISRQELENLMRKE